jgi:tetratricopeptide (TPR) repeat protein
VARKRSRKRAEPGERAFRLKPEATESQGRGATGAQKPEGRLPCAFRLQPEGLCVLLILLAGFWAYSNSFDGVFVLDDIRAIVRNETIRSLAPLADALRPPPMSTVSGRPLANFTFAVNYATSQLDVFSYHAVNLAIHLACALALFGVVRRTLQTPRLRPRFGHVATQLAAATAMIWVVHPLTTSAVTYIVQRVESLMSLFYLLTLYCAIRAADSERRGAWSAAAIASCALGMATKEVMITAPVAVALWDVVFRPEARPRWPLLGGLAATWLVFAILVSGEQREASIAMSLGMSWRYLLTQAEVLTRYLRLAIVPTPLIFLYTWPLVTSPAAVIADGLLVAALLALTAVGLWKRHPLGYAGAVFFLILAPTSSVIAIVTEVAAEHRMYLPLAAVIVSAIGAAHAALQRFASIATANAVVLVGTALLVGFYGIETRDRNRLYASDRTLWADTVAKDPANARARVAYGSVLAQGGQVQEAEGQFQRAVELNDSDGIAHGRLASALAAQGKLAEAVPHLQKALAINGEDVEAHRTLGQILAMQRDDAQALIHLERALKAQPDDPQLLVQVASVLADSREPSIRNPARAIGLAERAVELTGRREATALDVLGLAYARQGRFIEAASAARDALAIARASGNPAAASSIESRLLAYEQQLK